MLLSIDEVDVLLHDRGDKLMAGSSAEDDEEDDDDDEDTNEEDTVLLLLLMLLFAMFDVVDILRFLLILAFRFTFDSSELNLFTRFTLDAVEVDMEFMFVTSVAWTSSIFSLFNRSSVCWGCCFSNMVGVVDLSDIIFIVLDCETKTK